MRTALGVSIATVALADDDGSPVPDELIGRLYRSPRHGINELVSGLSTSRTECHDQDDFIGRHWTSFLQWPVSAKFILPPLAAHSLA